jgi:hypothetical protein
MSKCYPDRSFLAAREPPLRRPARTYDFPLREVRPPSPAWFLASVSAEQTPPPLLRPLLMTSPAILTLLRLALLLGIPALTSFFGPIWRPPKNAAPSVKLLIFFAATQGQALVGHRHTVLGPRAPGHGLFHSHVKMSFLA